MEEILTLKPEEQVYVYQQVTKNRSLGWFLKNWLGFMDMNEIHTELCSFLEQQVKFKLILMPRYSFKSSICTIGYSLWRLAKNPDLRILIYSDASTKAQGFLSSIKDHINGNVKGSFFRTIFDWTPTDKFMKWNESQIIIKGRKTAYPEPSIDTAGIDTSLIGRHYDIIIFDDVVSDINTTTKEQMDKTANCYKKALSLLKPGGEILMVGTRWHFGDLYGRIIAENGIKGVFGIFIKSAIDKDGKYLFDNIGTSSLTKEFLQQQKTQQGSYTFSCLYMNSPTDPETAVFKVQDFAFYGAVKKDDLYITCTCDPAGKGEDFTAITVVGTDSNMDMHILDIINEHLQPSEIVDRIIAMQYKYKFGMLGVETNFFRGMLETEIRRRRDIEHKLSPDSFRLFGIHEFEASSRVGQGKINRIMALQPYHERGALKFPGEKFELLEGVFSDLAWQMIQFPNSAHDDICFIKGTKIATIFGNKNIEDIKIGDKVITPFGIDEVIESKSTGYKKVINNMGLVGTLNHKIFTYNEGEKSLDTLTYRDILSILSLKEACKWIYRKLLFSMEQPIGLWGREDIILASQIPIKEEKILKDFTWQFGNFIIKRKFLKVMIFTIKMGILLITTQTIWNVYQVNNTINNLRSSLKNNLNIWKKLDLLQRFGTLLRRVEYGIVKILNASGRIKNQFNINVFGAEKLSLVGFPTINSVRVLANKQEEERVVDGMKQEFVNTAVKNLSATNIALINSAQGNVQQENNSTQEVFNLTIKNSGMYFANGILVSNCDSLAYHLPLIRRGGLVKKEELTRNTPAWLERKGLEKEFEKNSHLPRRFKRFVNQQLAFS